MPKRFSPEFKQQAVRQEFMKHRSRAGAPTIVHDVQAQGFKVSERTV